MDALEREKEIDLLERECCPFKEGDEYWGLNSDGSFSKMKWDNDSIDKSVLMLGNAFRTLEEARLEADRRDLLHNFKMFRDKCNGDWKPDWSKQDAKYFLYYSQKNDIFAIDYIHIRDRFHTFGYFKIESYAKKAIELFGDEIKRLYANCEV